MNHTVLDSDILGMYDESFIIAKDECDGSLYYGSRDWVSGTILMEVCKVE